MPANNPRPSNLLFPARTERGVERFAKTDMARQPDFANIDKLFGSLMSNPTLLARGGTWNDPMQAQQEATPGYLGARSGIAQEHMNTVANDASLAGSAGMARGGILDMINQLKAQQIGAQGSLFGSLLGGMF